MPDTESTGSQSTAGIYHRGTATPRIGGAFDAIQKYGIPEAPRSGTNVVDNPPLPVESVADRMARRADDMAIRQLDRVTLLEDAREILADVKLDCERNSSRVVGTEDAIRLVSRLAGERDIAASVRMLELEPGNPASTRAVAIIAQSPDAIAALTPPFRPGTPGARDAVAIDVSLGLVCQLDDYAMLAKREVAHRVEQRALADRVDPEPTPLKIPRPRLLQEATRDSLDQDAQRVSQRSRDGDDMIR